MNTNAVSDVVENGIVYAGKCIPMNDTLAVPLGTPLGDFIGGFWGLSPWIIGGVLIVCALAGVISALNDKAQKFFKAMLWVAAISVGVWFVAMIIFVMTGNQPDIPACPF